MRTMNGILLMLASDLTFALMAAATKCLGLGLTAVQIVFVRSLASTVILAAILLRKGLSFRAKEPALLWGRAIVGYIALQSYFWALPQLTLGTAVMLNYTAPLFAVILSFALLRENPTSGARVSLVLSLVGVWLLSSAELSGSPKPLLAGLLSGILAGCVHVMIRQSRKNDHPLVVIFYFTAVCTAASGALLWKMGWTTPTPGQWALLAAITMTSLAGQALLTYSLQAAPVWVVSPFGYFTPVMGLFLGALFWKEIPSIAGLLGGTLIIVCGTLMLGYFRKLEPA
jgi:drug/metabolite transporter (DMT)-like permease